MRQCDAVVVGAGPAGLAAAHALMTAGTDVTILEAAEHPGGLAWSERFEGYLVETGPHTFRGASEHLWRLLERVGLADEVEAMDGRAARYILRDGRLFRVPRGPLEFLLSGLLSPRAKWQALVGLFKAGSVGDRSVAQWTERRFGPEIRRTLVEPMVGGIFASDSEALDMARAFPEIWARTGASGRLLPSLVRPPQTSTDRSRGIFALRGGFGQLAETLSTQLGNRLHLASPVLRLETGADGRFHVCSGGGEVLVTDHLILATHVGGLERLLPALLPETATVLRRFSSVPMATVSLGGPGPSPLPAGFGALIPRGEGFRMLGAINVSALVPERAPAGHWLVTAYLGGRQDPQILDLDDKQLRGLVQDELARFAGAPLDVSMNRVHRHPRAIPQPDLDSQTLLAQLQQQVAQVPGLQLAGSYLEGVSMEAAVRSGLQAAARVKKEAAA